MTFTNKHAAADDQGLQVEREPGAAGRAVQLHDRPQTVTAIAGTQQGDRRLQHRASRCSRARTITVTESVPSERAGRGHRREPATRRSTSRERRRRQGHGRAGREHRLLRERARRAAADRLRRDLQGRRRPVRLDDGAVHLHGHRQDGRRRRPCPCSRPVHRRRSRSPPGNVDRRRDADRRTCVTAISTLPASALGPTNLTNGTATVVVPVVADTSRRGAGALREQHADGDAEGLQGPDGVERRARRARRSRSRLDATRTASSTVTIIALAGSSGACMNVPALAAGRQHGDA